MVKQHEHGLSFACGGLKLFAVWALAEELVDHARGNPNPLVHNPMLYQLIELRGQVRLSA